MSDETWTAEELFEGLTLQEGFIAELEKLDLLRVVARDGSGEPLYSADARDELEKVLTLIELGYQPKDIAAIAKRVGLPARRRGLFRRLPVRMRSGELARRTGISDERIQGWIAAGRLNAVLVSEGGDGLFGRDALDRIRLLVDLEAAELDSGDVERLLACLDPIASVEANKDEAAKQLDFVIDLSTRVRAKKDALRRIERSLAGLRKRLERASRAEGTRRRGRLGRRRRVHTTNSGRKGPGRSSDGD
jgi:DNA-binding transcriptional MerR regulator